MIERVTREVVLESDAGRGPEKVFEARSSEMREGVELNLSGSAPERLLDERFLGATRSILPTSSLERK